MDALTGGDIPRRRSTVSAESVVRVEPFFYDVLGETL